MSLNHQISALEASNLIHLASTQPEVEYLFQHALIQEAAYSSLLKINRRALHLAVGETLEKLYPDRLGELAATLAYHFELAQQWPTALQWLTRAADRAHAQFGLVEARGFYERALNSLAQLPPQPQTEFNLRLNSAVCAMLTGAGSDTLAPAFNRCLELAVDSEHRAEAHFRFGQMFHLYTLDDLAAAERHYAEALRLLTEAGKPDQYVTVLAHLGYLYRYQALPARSTETLEKAVALARSQELPQPLAQALIFISGAYLDLGREEEALEAAQEGLAIAQSRADLNLIGLAHSFLSDVYLARAEAAGEVSDAALYHLHEMQRFGREYGHILLGAFGAEGLAQCARIIGDREAELEGFAESARLFRAAGLPRRAAYRAARYGGALLEAGLTEAATEVFAQVRQDCSAEPGWAEILIGIAYAVAGQANSACSHIELGFTLAPSVDKSRQWLQQAKDALADNAKQRRLAGYPEVAAFLARMEAPQSGIPRAEAG